MAAVGGYCAARRGCVYSLLESSRLTALTGHLIRPSVRMIELPDRPIHQSPRLLSPSTKVTGKTGLTGVR